MSKCLACDAIFTQPKHGRQMYCSRTCGQRHRYHNGYRARLSQQRQMPKEICPQCGRGFRNSPKQGQPSLYCSNTCRKMAIRQRHRVYRAAHNHITPVVFDIYPCWTCWKLITHQRGPGQPPKYCSKACGEKKRKPKYRIKIRARETTKRNEAHPEYVKRLLVSGRQIPICMIPEGLVEAKRVQLKIHRLLKEDKANVTNA